MKIIAFAGTRPEAIKMAPVIAALRAIPQIFETRVCASGQHRELLARAFADFQIIPDINLDVMSENQTLAGLSSRLFTTVDILLSAECPDAILVQGDTTTVAVVALCAFYRNIPVGHVEAGLRSFNLRSPFPEEMNRRIATLAARWYFAPTELSRKNLLAEGIAPDAIHVTGNTVIDALLYTVEKTRRLPPAFPTDLGEARLANKRIVLITAHRRENFGSRLEQICAAIRRLATEHPDVAFVYPVHPNLNVTSVVHRSLSGFDNILLIEPMAYAPFIRLLDMSSFVLTDSGGLQEEAPSLGKPVLIMRDETERPEGVDAGVNILVGADTERIYTEAHVLLADQARLSALAKIANPFGDGTAGRAIADSLRRDLG